MNDPSITMSVSDGDQFVTGITITPVFDKEFLTNQNQAQILGRINGFYLTPNKKQENNNELKLYFKCMETAKNKYLVSAWLPPLK